MLIRTMRCEWRALRADRAVWLALGFFALLIGLGVWNGARWTRAQESVAPILAQQWEENRRVNIEFNKKVAADPLKRSILYHSGILAFQLWPAMHLPPAPLGASAIGQSDLNAQVVEARTRFDWARAPEPLDNPVGLLTGRFDLAFVIVYGLPLLILALCYNVLSGEREGGTLALALSQPVSLPVLTAAKILVRALLVFAVTGGAMFLFLLLNGGNPMAPGVAGRLFLWSLVVLFYGAFWFALAVWVNGRGWSSVANAGALAGVWVALVVVVPALVGAATETLLPAPPRLALAQAVQRADDEAKARGEVLLTAHYAAHPEQKPDKPDLNDYWTKRYAMDAHMERDLGPLLAQVENAATRRRRLASGLNLLSPALLAQGALGDVAGNGDARHRAFARQVDAFRAEWRAFFLPRVFRQTGLPLTQWDTVPRFAFQEESRLALASRLLLPCVALLGLSLLLTALSLPRLRRYPVAS